MVAIPAVYVVWDVGTRARVCVRVHVCDRDIFLLLVLMQPACIAVGICGLLHLQLSVNCKHSGGERDG